MRSSSAAIRSSIGAPGDHPVHLDRLGLADPVGAVGGLLLDGGVPPAVDVDHVVGAGEVEAGAAGLEREQEDRHARPWRPGTGATIASRSGTGVPPCRNWWGTPVAREVLLEQPRHGDVLGEDQHRAVLGEHGADQLVEQLELLRAAGEARRRTA